MQKRYIYIGIGVLVLLVVTGAWLWIARSRQSLVTGENISTKAASTAPLALQPLENINPEKIPAGETLVIQTASGGVTVSNFYRGSKQGEENMVVLKATADHFISYDPFDGSFWIALTGSSIETIHPLAEKDFLKILNISQRDACRLSVIVGPPYRSPSEPAQFSQLSFCAGNQ